MHLSLDALGNQSRFSSTDTSRSASRALLPVQLSSVVQGTCTNSLTVLDERRTKENLRVRFPTDRRPYTTRYDYEDDSDLEEDDDDKDDILDESAGVPQAVTEKPRNSSDIVVLENSDVKGNESPDIISVSDLDSLFSGSPNTKGETETTSSAHVGKVVVIEDVAFVTYVRRSPVSCAH